MEGHALSWPQANLISMEGHALSWPQEEDTGVSDLKTLRSASL